MDGDDVRWQRLRTAERTVVDRLRVQSMMGKPVDCEPVQAAGQPHLLLFTAVGTDLFA